MLFNTFEFGVFLVVVLGLYFSLPHRGQNAMLLLASYVFYGWWDWRFLGLIAASTLVDYAAARAIAAARRQGVKRAWLIGSLGFNLGVLGVFKYFNFFTASFVEATGWLGWHVSPLMMQIILPVGISFYTFQTMSYTIDVYRGQLRPTRSFLDFALFVGYFPQLVAGPIERATHLLPQIQSPRAFDAERFTRGGFLVFVGLFKKVVIADNLDPLVTAAFADPGGLDALSAALAVYCFAWQIYCDFSGYTDIARGVSAMLGIDLRLNFNLPYFATDPSDFWKRWHISLSSWLRDYLYIPLGGSRGGRLLTYRNLMLTMVLGGLWHGAAWTFVAWGVFHGLLLCGHRVLQRVAEARWPGLRVPWAVKVVVFFHLVCFGWLLFRAESMANVWQMTLAFTRWPTELSIPAREVGLIAGLWALQFVQHHRGSAWWLLDLPWPVRTAAYASIYAALLGLGNWYGQGFIYFQF